MQIRNLVSWAGRMFSFAPGDVIDLPADVAAVRIGAGLASAIDEIVSETAPRPGKKPRASS